jgi:hypothetical protein
MKLIDVHQNKFNLTSIIILVISILYLLVIQYYLGLKAEHLIIVCLFNSFYFAGGELKKFIIAFTPFVIFGIVYDMMKIYPNYFFNKIDIQAIYLLEKKLFGINYNNMVLTPNEYFDLKHNLLLDFVGAFFYLNWMTVPLGFAFYLYLKDRKYFIFFASAFLVVNLIGFCLYYVHPAAPPWYVKLYGFELHKNVLGNPAGFQRFDDFFNIKIFGSIYSKNSNIFAALPSLHAAYPIVALYYGLKSNKKSKLNYFFMFFIIGTWFAALYSGHHYLIDIILGIACAFTGIFLLNTFFLKIKLGKKILLKYQLAITNEKIIN